jgi:hypothetical protein
MSDGLEAMIEQTQTAELTRKLTSQGYAFVAVRYDSHATLVDALSNAAGKSVQIATTEVINSTVGKTRYKYSMSETYGIAEFPLHTDRAHDLIPPRFVLLSRVRGEAVALTRVLPIHRLPLTTHDLQTLKREVWHVFYGRRRFLTSLVNDTLLSGEKIFRYDPCCMRPTTCGAKSPSILREAIRDAEPTSFQLRSDATLVIDNWAALHGRSQVDEPSRARFFQRTLVRMSA